VPSVFHLHNVSSARELKVMVNGQYFEHDPHPVYLGITLDHTPSYKQHLTKVANNGNNRNNLLMKLTGSSLGANANTLRSSVLAHCYSVAEYCCPVWHVQHTPILLMFS